MVNLNTLEESLGVTFKERVLLEQALVHSSYINENPGLAGGSNERLEFLGDAVLGLVVAERLYQALPDLDEGGMTRMRAALVCRDTLARMAGDINLGDYLYLGKGEEAGWGRDKPANLAGALESVIAAVFRDRGLDTVRGLILGLLAEELEQVSRRGADIDYKSQLQELIQSRHQMAPTYHLLAEVGPDHDRSFTFEVRLGDVSLGQGSGKSKKAAETRAAHSALKRFEEGFTP